MLEAAKLTLGHEAIVARASEGDNGAYLRLNEDGVPCWIRDPAAATPFASMREAMRASLRLPGALRAFALPRDVECALAENAH